MADPQDDKQQPSQTFDAFAKSDVGKTAAQAPAAAPAASGGGGSFGSFIQGQQQQTAAAPAPTRSNKKGKALVQVMGEPRMMEVDVPDGDEATMEQSNDKGQATGGKIGAGMLASVPLVEPFAAAAAEGSMAPLARLGGSLLKGYLGAKAGHYIGKDVGGMVGDPELGGDIGGVAGGMYGSMGGKFPSKASMLEWLMSRGAASAPAAEAGAAEGAIANEPFKLTSPNTGSEAAIQQPMNFPPAVVSDEPFSLHAPAGETEPPVQSHLFGEMPKGNPTPFGKSPAVEVAGPSAPKPQKANIDTIVSEATGVKPIEKNVPLRDQVPNSPSNTEISGPGDPLKAKYPDKDVRQMVRANGEKIVDAVGDNSDLMKQIHDIDRVQLRQALINSGEDMGQTTISSSKYAGSGSISREEAFNRLLSKGIKPEQIVELAKKK